MAGGFEQTLRATRQRGSRIGWLVLSLALLSGWGAWMGWARVNLYASATEARLEVAREPSRVAAPVGGRIVRHDCELDRPVRAGDILMEVDSSVLRAELAQTLAEVDGLDLRILAAEARIRAEQAKWAAQGKLDELAEQLARHGLEQARVDTAEQEVLADMTRGLRAEELVAARDSLGVENELMRRTIQLSDASLRIDQLRAEQVFDAKAHLAVAADLERQVRELEGQRRVTRAAADTLRVRIEQAIVTAPASGRLGNVAALHVGAVVEPGDIIATVVPEDEVRVVAEFTPGRALGRVHAGQLARVKLEGFPWTEFGMIEATVVRVASEPRGGTVRVELALGPDPLSRVPLQHGLPGTVDICIGEASPWSLLLRAIGVNLESRATEPLEMARAGRQRP